MVGNRKFFEIIEWMYSATSLEDLHRTILNGMVEIVRGDTYELVLCETTGKAEDLYITKPDTFTDDEKSFALARAGEHPIVKAFEAGAYGVLSVSQCASDREWRASALFCEGGYRRMGLRHEVAVQLPGVFQDGLAAFSIARGSLDFSEQDLQLLDLIRPHVARAWTQVLRKSSRPTPALLRNLFPVLSPREAEILFWIIEGKLNPEIAMILERSLATIQEHVENIIRKLGMENRHQLTVVVLRSLHCENAS